MARPKCCRRISAEPGVRVFRPVEAQIAGLEEIVLSMDEFEAIRLADLEGLYQERAAERMNVSRQTFGRIIETARRKVAKVLADGLALRIEGGAIESLEQTMFRCNQCQHTWRQPCSAGGPEECPECQTRSVCRVSDQEGCCRRGEEGRGRQCRRRGD
jgi:uncharacterized protein